MLISDLYRKTNQLLHATNPNYGAGGALWAEQVKALAKGIGPDCTILDYGCGKAKLRDALRKEGMVVRCYDPAIPEFASRPAAADLVVCTDVLEHVEPHFLRHVLTDLAMLTKHTALLVACTRPAKKRLPTGENAHLIVQGESWWWDQIGEMFSVREYHLNEKEGKAIFIAQPREIES
jgi:2-polyprenyl-3-methyl-5-hydroxy-6-metoxy-1,4-benzoquinol methylase